jgi:cytochrome c
MSMHLLRKAALALATLSLALPAPVLAQSGADVIKTKGCANCHDPDKKKVGPSFKDIAAKNKGKGDALVAKVKEAKGHPKVAASEAEIKAAVEHILATK